uniref:triadin-like isoform X4 n=1 Tax=Gasterosteus aculeatus aculeatus TaxID=481459 RepID=UPI001A99690B|nr:triadin-like isoform X4 [Gasterosteus aculeatus aculeatus]
MAWLLVVALVITWSGVAIVLFDLLDPKTLTGGRDYGARTGGLPPPSAVAQRGLKARAGFRPMKSSPAEPPVEVASQESADWLEMMWTFAASMVAPDDEDEEGIQQLTEPLTSFHSEEL